MLSGSRGSDNEVMCRDCDQMHEYEIGLGKCEDCLTFDDWKSVRNTFDLMNHQNCLPFGIRQDGNLLKSLRRSYFEEKAGFEEKWQTQFSPFDPAMENIMRLEAEYAQRQWIKKVMAA